MPNQKKAKHARSYVLLTVLALAVAVGTVWLVKRSAYTMNGSLVCGKEEHRHDAACFEDVLNCEQEESATHTHTEQCQIVELICTEQEHTHGDDCYETEKAEADRLESIGPEVLRQSVPGDYTDMRTARLGEDATVYLFAQPGVIPEGVTLRGQVLEAVDSAFVQAQQRVQESGILYDHFSALDISLIDENGGEVEPEAPVYVSIDGGSLLPREAGFRSVQIQHHKEISRLELEEPQVQLETVVDDTAGMVTENEDTGSWVATFQVDSFSVYTITSAGWENLNIKVECVDEDSKELFAQHKPEDIKWDSTHTPDGNFEILFQTSNHPTIKEGKYQYLGITYYMENGEYHHQIYGLRRQDGRWYYFTDDNKRSVKPFNPQPDFEGTNPKNTIRSVYRKIMKVPVRYMDDAGSPSRKEIPLAPKDAPGGRNPDTITYYGTTFTVSNTDLAPKCDKYFYVGKAYV